MILKHLVDFIFYLFFCLTTSILRPLLCSCFLAMPPRGAAALTLIKTALGNTQIFDKYSELLHMSHLLHHLL